MDVEDLWKLANALPEPWRASSFANGIKIKDANGQEIVSISDEGHPNRRKVAYLIVMAPVLLKALLEIHRELLGFTWDTIWYRAQKIDKIIKRTVSKIT